MFLKNSPDKPILSIRQMTYFHLKRLVDYCPAGLFILSLDSLTRRWQVHWNQSLLILPPRHMELYCQPSEYLSVLPINLVGKSTITGRKIKPTIQIVLPKFVLVKETKQLQLPTHFHFSLDNTFTDCLQ